MQRINETKSWFVEKIYNIDKPLTKLTKRQNENNKLTKAETKGKHNSRY